MPEVDWRGFRIPWVHTADRDIFARCIRPPAPETLNWEDVQYDDGFGETVEFERPLSLRLKDLATTELVRLDGLRWAAVERARRSPLFETPVAHFLIRAFLAVGVDEVLAHMTTIEAALGLQADHMRGLRAVPDRHPRLGATKRVAARVAGLLGDRRHGDDYERLFDVRSSFLHGRKMGAISTVERILARSLARRVVEGLIAAANAEAVSREAFLDHLLDLGVSL